MSTSSSSMQRSSHGNLTKVFKCKSCVLILMDNDEERTARFIRLGEFVINLVMASMDRALVTCVCMVAGMGPDGSYISAVRKMDL
ncbi:unnamed protein product [Prunus armeniaca]